MKSKLAVIGLGALLCCVPAVSFFAFRDKNDTLGSYEPPVSWPVVQQTMDYKITLEPETQPLKSGKQDLKLDIDPIIEDQPYTAQPEVQVLMPMPGEPTMVAPVVLKKLNKHGLYEVQTEFSMAGAWELHVKPEPTAKAVQLDFEVAL